MSDLPQRPKAAASNHPAECGTEQGADDQSNPKPSLQRVEKVCVIGDVKNQQRSERLSLIGYRDLLRHATVHVLAVLPLPHALLICTSETLRYFDCSGVGKQYRTVTGQDSGGQILMGSQQSSQLR